MTLDQRAEKLEREYKSSRKGHGRSRVLWLKLREIRKRAIRANTRQMRTTGELPLFRGVS